MKTYIILGAVLVGSIALSAEAAATPIEWIERLIALIPQDGSTITMIALVLEFVLRLIPSAKPLSVVYWVADFSKHAAELLAAFAEFLDKVVGQKLQSERPNYNPPISAKK